MPITNFMRSVNASLLFLFSSLLLITACKDDDGFVFDPPTILSGPQQYGTPFDQVPAIEDIAMYEVNPRVFSSSQNLQGITERLENIQQLGINVVWLMPIYQTGTERSVGSPYAIRDYQAIHADYGTLDDLRALVDKAHSLGMAVMLDWVANHTAWDNEWINNPSWYAQDRNGNIIHPPGTNWQDVAELNYDNVEMREEMIKAMKYWVLEANIDGYRCDFAEGAPADFWQQAIDTLRHIPNRELILFAEAGDKDLLDVGFDLIFGWPFYGKLLNIFGGQPANGLYIAHLNEYSGLDEHKHILRWVTNHDQHAWDGTPQSFFNGNEGTLAAFVLAAYMGGVPLVYNGQEVAVPQQLPFFEGNTTSINWSLNPDIRAEYERILTLRKTHAALRRGETESYSTADIAAFTRQYNDEQLLVLVNVRDGSSSFEVPAELLNSTWVNTADGSILTLGSELELGAFQYLILQQ
ncbi:MAG: hypothetical protein KDC44_08780 [Phaeodactylibacter sp.]|nr:hypothetical protein [Phaeodactylibacter sp.]